MMREATVVPVRRRALARVRIVLAAFRPGGWSIGPRDALPGTLAEIASYHAGREEPGSALPERVARDLDLDAVFARIDRCNSAVGQQVLFDMLRRPLYSEDGLGRVDRAVRAFADEADLRESVLRATSGLRTRRAYSLPNLFQGEPPRRPRWWPLFPLLAALVVLALVLSLLTPLALVAVAALVLVNMGIQASYRPTIEQYVAPMSAVAPLLRAGRTLAGLSNPALNEDVAELSAVCDRLRGLERRWPPTISSCGTCSPANGSFSTSASPSTTRA